MSGVCGRRSAAGAVEKKKKKEKEEEKRKVTEDLQTKEGTKERSRQTKTKSIQTKSSVALKTKDANDKRTTLSGIMNKRPRSRVAPSMPPPPGPVAARRRKVTTTLPSTSTAGAATKKTSSRAGSRVPPGTHTAQRQCAPKSVSSTSRAVKVPTSTNTVVEAATTSTTVSDIVAETAQCPQHPPNGTSSEASSMMAVLLKVPPPSLKKTSDVPDPDIGTRDDPQLCGEYIKDIYEYLLQLESRPVYVIDEKFLSHQVEVKKHHRGILVDWLIQVHKRFLLVPETLYLAVDILDRSLQVSFTQTSVVQLIDCCTLNTDILAGFGSDQS